MVILGIDPGLANTGWGIVEERRGEVRCRAYGCIETSSGSDLAARLRRIADELTAVVDRYRPQEAAVEGIYFGANVRSAISHRPCPRRCSRRVLPVRGRGGGVHPHADQAGRCWHGRRR